ncbi:hypothetical protein [Streptomyces sp. NPDC050485]|uniref:hypothetical protein n=1 Tax=Streptomyces sp. NPDC050485 TaxID=3365617 RepID=UPI003791EE69
MADERHEWLDRDAAERLLRGESVEPGDERARAEAARLSALLRSAARPEPSAAELPGEAAALAAFRTARPQGADDTEALGVVRVGRVAPVVAAPRRRRIGPVRLGLAAALACCALGGVAVAAGTGVLPGPFSSDNQDPTPAATVSAEVNPDPVVTSPAHSPGPGSPTPGRHEPSSGTGASGGGSPGATPGGPASGGTGDAGKKGGPDQGGASGDQGDDPAQWLARTADDCRDYRSGRLDQERRRNLESAAHGSAAVKEFCDLLLDGKGGKSGGTDGGGNGDGSGNGDGKDKGKGDGSGNKNGGGGGGKQNSVATRPGQILDWLKPGVISTPVAH